MLRKSVLGIAAAAIAAMVVQTANVTSANAGGSHFSFSFGAPGYYGGYGPYYHNTYEVYHAPVYDQPVYHHCEKVFVGYEKVHTYYGYEKHPVYKKHCYYE